jgi:hypothetical protein
MAQKIAPLQREVHSLPQAVGWRDEGALEIAPTRMPYFFVSFAGFVPSVEVKWGGTQIEHAQPGCACSICVYRRGSIS